MSAPQPIALPALPQVTIARSGMSGEKAFGGGLEGAERTSAEMLNWTPSMGSPDQVINRVKPMADARGRDMVFNDGKTHGAIRYGKDTIVGSHFRLNANPAYGVLERLTGAAFDDTWAEEFQEVAEELFQLCAEGETRWLDATRTNTLTDMIRLSVGQFSAGGESIYIGKWLNKDRRRPFNTAIQAVAAARLSNPDNGPDEQYLRRGVKKNFQGEAIGYYFRNTHPSESWIGRENWSWTYVEAEKPWGRRQVLHIIEQLEIDQTRGVADMVSALKHMRMTKNFSEVTLQNAVINASYAAAIESELPPDVVYGMMGGADGPENMSLAIGAYAEILKAFLGGSNNIKIDGAKVPVLPPGTKLNTKTFASPGGIGGDFEASLERHIAAALGLSAAEFSRDWRSVSYSGGRLAQQQTASFVKSQKKAVADRIGNFAYTLWLEEMIAKGLVPLPRGVDREFFYMPLVKEAICKASWIGAGFGQIDEVKETQAAIMKINAGLSTREVESAKLGTDMRDNFRQLERERRLAEKRGLVFGQDATRPGTNDAQQTMNDGGNTP